MSTSNRAVAIDGPAASGKSTVAKRLAAKLGLVMVNSGAMYRAITWELLERNVDPQDPSDIVEELRRMELNCGVAGEVSTVGIDGRLLTDELRHQEVNDAVSHVATVPEVRELLVGKQRAYLEERDVVMEGRDIGSVVFPDTPYKLYITASEEVRAARRSKDGEADVVAARDKQDSQRKISPLKVTEGAVVIDSSELTIDQTVEAAYQALIDLGWQD